VDNGSFDPSGRDTELKLSYNGGPESDSLEFDATGDYLVTLTINVLENDTVIASASATATVSVVDVSSGTENEVLWVGQAGTALMPDRREWMWSGNWFGNVPPANPTAGTVRFGSTGQAVTSIVEQDRTVDTLHVYHGGETVNHTIDLGGNVLTITNTLRSGVSQIQFTTLNFINGTVKMGTEEAAAQQIHVQRERLNFSSGAKLYTANLSNINLLDAPWGGAILDLRGAEIVGGTLHSGGLNISGRNGAIAVSADTTIDTIHISGTALFSPETGDSYIGDPDDAKLLPAGINLRFGTDETARGQLRIGEARTPYGAIGGRIQAALGDGGVFTAYLSKLGVGVKNIATSTYSPYGILDVAEMDSCYIDATDLLVAPGKPEALDTDNERGELRLPTGTMKALLRNRRT